MTAELPQPEVTQPEVPQPEVTPVRQKPGRGRWLALGTALVLSAVVVGGGAGFAVLGLTKKPVKHVAARKPAAPRPPAYGALSNGNHFGSLSDLMLPVPDDMTLGPDFYEYGNDTVLSAPQFHALFDKSIAPLSTAARRAEEQYFQASHTKGYALRSYLVSDTTSIVIALRQENQNSAAQNAAASKELAEATNVFRPGPAVPGFPGVHCYLPPLASGDKLDYMDCDASVGDIAVWMDVSGVAPLDSASAVSLLSQQLTRLAIPGAQT